SWQLRAGRAEVEAVASPRPGDRLLRRHETIGSCRRRAVWDAFERADAVYLPSAHLAEHRFDGHILTGHLCGLSRFCPFARKERRRARLGSQNRRLLQESAASNASADTLRILISVV